MIGNEVIVDVKTGQKQIVSRDFPTSAALPRPKSDTQALTDALIAKGVISQGDIDAKK
jgi:hypothetical protein